MQRFRTLRSHLAVAALVAGCGSRTTLDDPEPEPSRTLAFIADRDELNRFELYVVDPLDATDPTPHNLSRSAGAQEVQKSASWSPDGRFIAYQAEQQLVVADATRGFAVQLQAPNGGGVSWSSASNWLANIWDGELVVTDVTTGATFREPLADGVYVHGLKWSPRGARLLFPGVREGTKYTELFVVEPGAPARSFGLASHGLTAGGGVWSPDGLRVGFVAESDVGRTLWVADLEGVEPKLRQVHAFGSDSKGTPTFSWGDSRLLLVRSQLGLRALHLDQDPPSMSELAPGGSPIGLWISPDHQTLALYFGDSLQFRAIHDGRLGEATTIATERVSEVIFGPTGRHALLRGDSGTSLRHVRVRGGPVTWLGEGDQSQPTFAPDGASVLFRGSDPTRLMIAELEPQVSVREFRQWESRPTLGRLEWLEPAAFSYVVDGNLFLGSPSDHSVRELHRTFSNLRSIGWTAWQPEQP